MDIHLLRSGTSSLSPLRHSHSHFKPVEIHWMRPCSMPGAYGTRNGTPWLWLVYRNQRSPCQSNTCATNGTVCTESNYIIGHSRNLYGYLKLKDVNHSQPSCMCTCKPPLLDQFFLPVQTASSTPTH